MDIGCEKYLRGKNDRKNGVVNPESFVERFKELQNNMGWEGPLKFILYKSSEQIQLDEVQSLFQMSFEYLQNWRFNSLFTQPVLLFDHPHGKIFFPNIPSEFPMCQLVTVASPFFMQTLSSLYFPVK